MQIAELRVCMTKANRTLLKEPTTDCHSQQKGDSVIMILCVFIGFLLGLCWCSSSVEGKDSCKSHTGEQIVGVLALSRGGMADRSRVNRDTLQQDLSLESDGDLHVVLAFAEKIRPNTYIDVLGDPQLHSEAVIREFEAL